MQQLTADPAYIAEAKSRGVDLFYRNSADATEFWHDIDETFGPLVDTFRSGQSD